MPKTYSSDLKSQYIDQITEIKKVNYLKFVNI
jgi:hypothetical protein